MPTEGWDHGGAGSERQEREREHEEGDVVTLETTATVEGVRGHPVYPELRVVLEVPALGRTVSVPLEDAGEVLIK